MFNNNFRRNILENIQRNREFILSKIKETHRSCIYSQKHVPKLVAVSKKQEDFKIDEAIKCGQEIFGENIVQEA